jgi:hypothetical protein
MSLTHIMNNRKATGHRGGLGGMRRLAFVGNSHTLLVAVMGLGGMVGGMVGIIMHRAVKFSRVMSWHYNKAKYFLIILIPEWSVFNNRKKIKSKCLV